MAASALRKQFLARPTSGKAVRRRENDTTQTTKSTEITSPTWSINPVEKTAVRTELNLGKQERASVSVRYVNQSIKDSLDLGGTSAQMQAVLSNRLRLALRQETGLAYSPSASIQVFSAPLNGIYLNVDVTVALNDVTRVEEAIKNTVQSLTLQPPSAEELEAFRESYGAANRNLFADPNGVAELLLTLHLRKVSTQELQRVRQTVLTRDANSILINFKNILSGVEPSVGIHRPESK
jgi:predicted Zn-dependent peptidase